MNFLSSYVRLSRLTSVHLVLDELAHLAQLPLELDFDLEVQITDVPFVGLAEEGSLELFALFDGEIVIEVKHRLFPVSVRTFGGCGRKGEVKAVQDQAGIPRQEKYQFF